MRPVVKVLMVNEQGNYEGDAHWDVVENSIGPINYADSVDLVYNPHYKQSTSSANRPTSYQGTNTRNTWYRREMQRASLHKGKYDEDGRKENTSEY